MRFSNSAALALTLVSSVSALTPAEWRSQSIYQVLTDRFARTDGSTTAECDQDLQPYCGGTWRGIINKLDYIQGMGFTAVWISPVTAQVEGMTQFGSAYHGFWQKNMNEINTHFGSKDDLKALSAALHARGMYLMVDVVTNHMASIGATNKVDYKSLAPFNDASYFHPYCKIDYYNGTSANVCWLGDNIVALPDLKTEDQRVRTMLNTWIKNLVSDYGIDGLRLDTAKHVSGYLREFQTAAGGIHVLGEVYTGGIEDACNYQGPNALSGVMNFPAYYQILNVFGNRKGSMKNLAKSVYKLNSVCKDVNALGSFMENHDVPRFPTVTKDLSLTKNAIAYNMLQDGIPIIYYGQEQQYWAMRGALWHSQYSTTSPLYQFIASINRIRNHAISLRPSYTTYWGVPTTWDSTTIIMRKGDTNFHTISVFSNLGESGPDYILPITYDNHFFGRNAWVVEVTECVFYTTDKDAKLNVKMSKGLPRVFFRAEKLVGTGICPEWDDLVVKGDGTVVKNGKRRDHVARHVHSHRA